jgi:peptidoglycan/xylan/chitin deacetylase (PgdA/CDA1 family)
VRTKTLLRDALIGAVAPLADAAYRERPRIRVISFHDTPVERKGELRDRLRGLRDRAAVVPLADAFARERLDAARLNVVLTFDDGLAEHHAVAAPVLDELGLAATFFVPTGALDLAGADAAAFSRDGLRRSRAFAFMTTGAVRELADHPSFDVGGHTHSHRDLGRDSDPELELVAPKRLLEEKTGQPVRWFAYPFGSPTHLSARSVEAIRAAGYETAFTIVPSFWSRTDDPFLLGRDALSLDDSPGSWERFLRGGYDALSGLKYRRTLARVRRERTRV